MDRICSIIVRRGRAAMRIMFPTTVRGALYTGGCALVSAGVANGSLPWWALFLDGPLLLAVLHLTPDDVEPKGDQ